MVLSASLSATFCVRGFVVSSFKSALKSTLFSLVNKLKTRLNPLLCFPGVLTANKCLERNTRCFCASLQQLPHPSHQDLHSHCFKITKTISK
ncbi:hypothetical protein RRG08_055964 [Elysia crispata]|uniref:Uncharacterized protein n=1 Tax=Elysia crispata TaxID=231223 RepID=A0AAE1AHK7_9GAST|nr:hypothetical protein RRG08_055964 [Elysia crispata]